MNSRSRSTSEELVGIDDQKETILRLIRKEDSRVIGLWGMGGIGKTTLADVVFRELKVSPGFDDNCFLQNVTQEIEMNGKQYVRNKLVSKLLDEKEISLDTPSIGSGFIQERLNNKRLLVVLDDVNGSGQIEDMGVKDFGHGSKIIVTSRDKQVLKIGGADEIHEVNTLNENDSLQLFSTYAFRLLNPAAAFRDLVKKFLKYAQGSPLALKVLGAQLYERPIEYWQSEVDNLRESDRPEIFQILKRSFDGLNRLEKDIFLDIACFFKNKSKEEVEEILSCCYKGAVSGISNLLDKCLLDIQIYAPYFGEKRRQWICMHNMLEDMGKEIVRQESKSFRMRSRLWNSKDVEHLLRYNRGTESIQGIKLDMSQIDDLQLNLYVFENMFKLRFILFYFSGGLFKCRNKKLHANRVDSISLPDELRYLWWEAYPFQSFMDQNQYQLLDYSDYSVTFFMVFSNCSSLNQDSIDNIEANAMLKIESLAKRHALKYGRHEPRLFCCLPGSKISTNTFEYQSVNSSLILKIAPNGCGGSRLLVFTICLVADLTGCIGNRNITCICRYQLTYAGGGYEKFRSEWYCGRDFVSKKTYIGNHVLILFDDDMVKEDKDYEEASFEFYIKYSGWDGEEIDFKVEKCGVHVSYVNEQHKRTRIA